MVRILFTYILPLVLPTALYVGYTWWQRRKAAQQEAELPAFERTPLFISILLGFALMVAALTWIAVVSGEAPGEGEYTSPRYEDGKIVPPTFK